MIEKRYRDFVNQRFEQLQNVLRIPIHHGMEKEMRIKRPKRLKRAAILEYARRDIITLQAEVELLEEKLENLRQTAFPDTYKYTIRHSRTTFRA